MLCPVSGRFLCALSRFLHYHKPQEIEAYLEVSGGFGGVSGGSMGTAYGYYGGLRGFHAVLGALQGFSKVFRRFRRDSRGFHGRCGGFRESRVSGDPGNTLRS